MHRLPPSKPNFVCIFSFKNNKKYIENLKVSSTFALMTLICIRSRKALYMFQKASAELFISTKNFVEFVFKVFYIFRAYILCASVDNIVDKYKIEGRRKY